MVAAVCAAWLLGCVSTPDTAELQLKPIVYAGRFTMSYQKLGTLAREQGRFEWKIQDTARDDKAMQLSLLSPLGTTLALIAYNPSADAAKRASFTSPINIEFAPDLDTLMHGLLGWQLPLAALTPWLSRTPPAQTLEDWKVSVLSRHDNGLPKIMTADNAVLQLSTRLVFEEPAP